MKTTNKSFPKPQEKANMLGEFATLEEAVEAKKSHFMNIIGNKKITVVKK